MKVISKNVWLGLLCIVVLVAAVGGTLIGTYIGNRISSLESQVDSLQETVSSLEGDRDSLQNNVSTLIMQLVNLSNQLKDALSHNTTITMNITFVFEEHKVFIVVNDSDYNSKDWLAVFASNGSVGGSVQLYADNGTILGVMLCADGSVVDPTYSIPVQWTNLFSCVFEDGVGYTFKITFPSGCYTALNSSWLFIFYDADSGNRIFGFHWPQGG